MSKINLVPTDSLTERLLVDVIAAMIKTEMAKKKAAATSEFPRPDAATAEVQSVETDTQVDSTTAATTGQNKAEEFKLGLK